MDSRDIQNKNQFCNRVGPSP